MKRRSFIKASGLGITGASVLPYNTQLPSFKKANAVASEIVVVGAGAFGVWTAYSLQKSGAKVTLVDAYGPGNSRASSGGETRLIQVNTDKPVYIKSAVRAFELWKEMEQVSGEQLVLETGRLLMSREENYADLAKHRAENLKNYGVNDTEVLSREEVAKRWPQIYTDDIKVASYNKEGAGGSTLMARKACQVVADQFIKAGGKLAIGKVEALKNIKGNINEIQLQAGEKLKADNFIFACGPWLPKLIPSLLPPKLQVQRRDVIFIGVPAGDTRFSYPNFPEWSVTNSGFYGFADIEGRGLKVAVYPDPNSFDPDLDERLVNAYQVKRTHDFVKKRFPAMAGQPVIESRVCQVTNSVDSNFIIDQHPEAKNLWIMGGGSGHAFKHGPSMGEYAAKRILSETVNEAFDTAFRLKSENFQ